MTTTLPDRLRAARGETPADLLLRNGRVVNVFNGRIESVGGALLGETIVGMGPGYRATRTLDLEGRHLVPGLIDAHVHIESSMVTPPQFARAVLPRGTTTVVSDPHEIANVHGLEGIRYMLEASDGLPLSVFVMASSCVPATHMGTAGADLDAASLRTLTDHPRVIGLAELMNFPGAIHGDPGVLAKLEAFHGRVVDGHAPGVRGSSLNAYAVAGPESDHECTTLEEAEEKLARGLRVLIREATNARNLEALLPLIRPDTLGRILLCTDDRQPPDLLDVGGIDHMIRRIIGAGVPPVDAIRLATLNTSEYFGLRDRGGIAPGRRADLLVVGADLERFEIEAVYAGGTRVAESGSVLWKPAAGPPPPEPSMQVELAALDLSIPVAGEAVRVIEVVPDQIVTGAGVEHPKHSEGWVVPDPDRDLLKICVVERHRGTGNVGLGIVRGIGLKQGAIAGTVAHDHHNIIAIGVDDASIRTAIARVAEMDGGLAAARGDTVLASLKLAVGGLMTEAPIEEARAGLDGLLAASAELGTPLHDPFMAMAFLGLEVIPSLKITDQGLVDVGAFERVGLWV